MAVQSSTEDRSDAHSDYLKLEADNYEEHSLLDSHHIRRPSVSKRLRLSFSQTLNVILTFLLIVLGVKFHNQQISDPTIAIYSPANSEVEYVETHFTAGFFKKTPYMGFPTNKTDELWEDLYNFGISTISEKEAKKLTIPTMEVPGRKGEYLVQLDVFHQLHCLNDLRKLLYPEVYGGMNLITKDGVVQRESNELFRHWDHCVDALRQAIMCNGDVSPLSWHVNVPVKTFAVPRFATAHTCRNFEKIRAWGKANSAGNFNFSLTPAKATEIIENSSWSHDPEEDIEDLWPAFPGNKFFKHWRENPAPAKSIPQSH